MWRFIAELLSYLSFVIVVSLISFLSRNSQEYLQARHLNDLFLNQPRASYNFTAISTVAQFWTWLEGSFIETIEPEQWYNGRSDNASIGFLSDRTNRLIGWATMRQLRVKADTCRIKTSMQTFIRHCYDEYGLSIEEKRSFQPGWTMNATKNYSLSIAQAFLYQTSAQLDTYPYIGELQTYGSGGYVYEFRGSLSKLRNELNQLHQLQWIDSPTRAVLIQLNLFNPNIAIFTSVAILIEILSSSGIYPSARFEPLDLYVFNSAFHITCAAIYFVFIICFMIMEVRSIIRLKKLYFRQAWSYIELGIIFCSWAAVGIHIWRTKEASRIGSLFRETSGGTYLNFQLLAYINDIFSFLLGFCCFFGMLRLLRLCRYNERLNLLSNTLKRASQELISFSMMFSVIFMAFLTLYYLQFTAYIWECSTLLHTAQMLFEMLLLKFDATGIKNAAPVLGPLYFALFILFVVFVCINMFVSIINDNFRSVQADVYKTHSDYMGVFSSLRKKIRHLCGLPATNVVSVDEQPKIVTVSETADPLKRLSSRLDRLSTLLNRIDQNGKEQYTSVD
ncbi:unnamed protein product [Adineta ricciae]|uniref:Uncharacterized protein n=1 Tax=Adineta ricciae TaxID=249248 RepID=A0A816BFB7_ADIRI|nr:unnamed protein product [Adineta ricciae]CAF1610090.1 unnamed protein product [Adineta ricciae]